MYKLIYVVELLFCKYRQSLVGALAQKQINTGTTKLTLKILTVPTLTEFSSERASIPLKISTVENGKIA